MKARILVVDDEEEIRTSLARHFKMKGYETVPAGSVDEAVEVLNSTPIQVLISDIVMPEKHGTELLDVLADSFPMIQAIMITGYVTLDNALKCMRKGADTCIFKPFNDFSELDDAVERAYRWHIRWQEKLKELNNSRQN